MNLYYGILICILPFLKGQLHPVLLVPGWGGSHLSAKYLEKPKTLPCNAINKTFLLWIDPAYFLPPTINCVINLLKLEYDPINRTTYSPKFCEINSPGFGTIDTIGYLTEFKFPFNIYFASIIKELTQIHNYKANVNLRGAPYDFRKAPNEMRKYFLDVKNLIEKMYNEANGKSVVLMGHSFGNLLILELLNQVTQNWKDKYIRTLISISGPYAGSIVTVQTILSGFSGFANFLNNLNLRKMESTWPSFYYMLPKSKVWSDEPIVLTKERNFTASEMREMFVLSGIKYSSDHFDDQRKYLRILPPPNVEINCIISTGKKTPLNLNYNRKEFPDSVPEYGFGNGDGTVPLRSLMICPQWKNKQSKTVTLDVINDVNHMGILRDEKTVRILREIMKKINN